MSVSRPWVVRAGAVAVIVGLVGASMPAAHAVQGTIPTGAAAAVTVKLDIAGDPTAVPAPDQAREKSCSGVLLTPLSVAMKKSPQVARWKSPLVAK